MQLTAIFHPKSGCGEVQGKFMVPVNLLSIEVTLNLSFALFFSFRQLILKTPIIVIVILLSQSSVLRGCQGTDGNRLLHVCKTLL